MRPKKLVIRKPISKTTQIFLGFISVFILFLFYEYLSIRQHWKNPRDTTMPGVFDIYKALLEVVSPNNAFPHAIPLLEDFKATGFRYIFGIFLGVLFSLFIGLWMACFAKIEALFHRSRKPTEIWFE